jgi:O-antigen/teichoic acid export membrane protein
LTGKPEYNSGMNARHDAEHSTSPTGKPDVPKPPDGGILNLVLHRLLTWRPGGYLRASGGLFGWLLLRAAAQAAMVVLLARVLGVEGYGLFVTALAVSGFFSPIAGLGLGGLLLRDGAREPAALPRQLGMALALWWPAALVCSAAATALLAWSLPSRIPLAALAAFALAEIGAASFLELAARVEQARHRVGAFGAIQAGMILARLAALLLYAALGAVDPVGWLWVYAASSAIYAAFLARRLVAGHRPVWPQKRDWRMARESFPFTIGALSVRLQAEFNKPLLARASYGQAGSFGVAQRAVELASLPLQALQEALWPRLYSGRHSARQLWFVGAVLFAAALLGGGVLVLLAPWIARLLGAGFEATTRLVMLLALLPALQLVRNLLNAVVAQQRRQSVLTAIYLAGGVAGVLLNLWLVPAGGLHGAVAAAYLTEAVLFVLLGAVVLPKSKRLHNV